MNKANEWRQMKLVEIREKLKAGVELNEEEKTALLFWRANKWLLKEE